MPRARMFRPGDVVTMAELCEGLSAREYFYMNDKPTHPGWIGSMQMNTVMAFIRQGRVRRAIRNDQTETQTEG